MKRFALAIVAVFFFVGCGQQTATQEEAVIETYEIAELISNPLDFENQEVRIEGIISHICRHSGEKMRVAEIDGCGHRSHRRRSESGQRPFQRALSPRTV